MAQLRDNPRLEFPHLSGLGLSASNEQPDSDDQSDESDEIDERSSPHHIQGQVRELRRPRHRRSR